VIIAEPFADSGTNHEYGDRQRSRRSAAAAAQPPQRKGAERKQVTEVEP